MDKWLHTHTGFDLVTYPCYAFNGALSKPSVKSGHGYTASSHRKLWFVETYTYDLIKIVVKVVLERKVKHTLPTSVLRPQITQQSCFAWIVLCKLKYTTFLFCFALHATPKWQFSLALWGPLSATFLSVARQWYALQYLGLTLKDVSKVICAKTYKNRRSLCVLSGKHSSHFSEITQSLLHADK